jgi:hypothetical protein
MPPVRRPLPLRTKGDDDDGEWVSWKQRSVPCVRDFVMGENEARVLYVVISALLYILRL